jgi:hypothetical protein
VVAQREDLLIVAKLKDEATAAVGKLQKHLEGIGGTAGKVGQQAGASLAGIGVAAALAGTGVGTLVTAFLGLKVVQVAIDLLEDAARALIKFSFEGAKAALVASELNAKLDLVAGESAPRVRREMELLGDATGRATTALIDQFGQFQVFGNALGITQEAATELSGILVRLGLDLASALEVDDLRVFEGLEGVLRGNTRAFEGLGPTISDLEIQQEALRLGLAATTDDITDQDKALAALSVILGKTTFATGEAINEVDSLEGQFRQARANLAELSEEIGGRFLVLLERTGAVQGFADAIKILDDFLSELSVSVNVSASSIRKLLAVASIASPILRGLFKAGESLGLEFQEAQIERLGAKLIELGFSAEHLSNVVASAFVAFPGDQEAERLAFIRAEFDRLIESAENAPDALDKSRNAFNEFLAAFANIFDKKTKVDLTGEALKRFESTLRSLNEELLRGSLSPEDRIGISDEMLAAIDKLLPKEAERLELAKELRQARKDELSLLIQAAGLSDSGREAQAAYELLGRIEDLRAAYEDLNEEQKELREIQRQNRQLFQSLDAVAGNLTSSFVAFATGAQSAKEAFKNFAVSVIGDLLAIQARAVILRSIGFALSAFSPGLGNAFSAGQGFAQGGVAQSITAAARGTVIPPGPHLVSVNEGPPFREAVLPLTATSQGLGVRAVVPEGGGGGVSFQVSIFAVDSQSFVAMAARDPKALAEVVVAGMRSNPTLRNALTSRGVFQ